ncbi:serine/threonine-protein kinase [Streptomyces gamaensis]|uniref:Serine/threonine-protein kinase n=1 Tax=Streptomyces gamaensis TaxID=1763542 RepID=A0ABW0Z4G3_9ACTN
MPPLRRSGTGPEPEDPQCAGPYRLEGRLGSGGMGVVHLARSASGMRLAVKVVHPEYAVDPEFRARFRQEVAAARRVSGAFTAPVVDADPDGERPWMATLYIPGPTLSERVKRNGPLNPAEVRQLAAGLAEALRDIHRAGVVHRDLKPSNVLLAEDGPKVIDFGISRPYDSELRTETGKLIGTPPFMAPEQFQRPREVGPAADVFALASLLVHAATGRGPFESDSPYIVAYQVVHNEPDLTGLPADLVPLIRDCLAKEPALRPSPDALMSRLQQTAREPLPSPAAYTSRTSHTSHVLPSTVPQEERERPQQAEPHQRLVPVRRPRGGRRRAVWTVAAAVGAVALAGGAYWVLAEAERPGSPLQTRPTAAGHEWQPWQMSMLEEEESEEREERARGGFCTYAQDALYCSADGVQASRIDPRTGRPVWRRAGASARSAPVACGGLIHVVTPDGKVLTALDPATGEPRWTRNVAAYEGRVYHTADTVLLVAADGTVTAVDGGTSRELWHQKLPRHTRPVFSSYGEGPVYAVSPVPGKHRTEVLALDAQRGTTLWQRTAEGDLTAVGNGTNDALILTALDSENRVSAVVRYEPNGQREYRVRPAAPLYATSVAARGDAVYMLSSDGGLTAVDTRPGGGEALPEVRRGGQLWRLETAVANASALVATDERLYFSAADGRLLAVDTARGSLLGQTPPRLTKAGQGYPDLPPKPVAAEGKVFGATPDGKVFAVDAADPSGWH